MEEIIAAMARMEKSIIGEIRELKDAMEKREAAWEIEKKTLVDNIEGLERRFNDLEKKEKRNNIIISNLETEKRGNQLIKEVEKVFKDKIEGEIEITEARA